MLDKRGIKSGYSDGGIDVRTDGGAKHTCSDGTASDPIGDQGTSGNLGTQGMRAAGDGLIRTDASQALSISNIHPHTQRQIIVLKKKSRWQWIHPLPTKKDEVPAIFHGDGDGGISLTPLLPKDCPAL